MTPSSDKTSNDEVLIFTYILFHHELIFKSLFLPRKCEKSKTLLLWVFIKEMLVSIFLLFFCSMEKQKITYEYCAVVFRESRLYEL